MADYHPGLDLIGLGNNPWNLGQGQFPPNETYGWSVCRDSGVYSFTPEFPAPQDRVGLEHCVFFADSAGNWAPKIFTPHIPIDPGLFESHGGVSLGFWGFWGGGWVTHGIGAMRDDSGSIGTYGIGDYSSGDRVWDGDDGAEVHEFPPYPLGVWTWMTRTLPFNSGALPTMHYVRPYFRTAGSGAGNASAITGFRMVYGLEPPPNYDPGDIPGVYTLLINDDNSLTTKQQVHLDITCEGEEADQMSFSEDGTHWTAWEAYAPLKSFVLTAPGSSLENRTVYMRVRNLA
jgi:hypothetical protein